MPFNKWMEEQMVVYPYNEILFSDNKEMSCQTTMEKHSCMLLSGRS